MTDAVLQRKNMVESQVRPSDVTDRRITAAMMALPRELFVPANFAALAYMDEALTFAPGRALLAPREFARLVQLAAIEPDDRVLVIGGSGGYGAAVLSRLAARVVSLDADAAATKSAEALLERVGAGNVQAVCGPLNQGWQADAPYNAIVIEGRVGAVPEMLFEQLTGGGRLAVIETDGGVGRAILYKNVNGTIARRVAFESAAPELPGFERQKAGFSL
jgi:protein-L-isoaspartate(D-aspartate) O-methyltransferase